jgi:hypothetical protein
MGKSAKNQIVVKIARQKDLIEAPEPLSKSISEQSIKAIDRRSPVGWASPTIVYADRFCDWPCVTCLSNRLGGIGVGNHSCN